MGRPDLTDVIVLLQEAGYRTGRAYPGVRMPNIQTPVVAVALQKDEEDRQILAVTILCPEYMGGGQCEDVALGVTEVLRKRGYDCVQEHCQYDGKGDRFSVRILATWVDEPGEYPCAVSMGLGAMNDVTGFSSQQKTELQGVYAFGQSEPVALIPRKGYWEFTLEEFLPVDAGEPQEPEEPFTMVVRRGVLGEIYGGCYWTSVSRQDEQDGLRVIRKGTAMTRSLHTYE